MTQASESLREASLPTVLLTTKTKTRIGTWNILTLYETGRIAQVSKEMKEYSMKIMGLCETRWTEADRRTLVGGETIIYSGHEDGHVRVHEHEVGMIIAPDTVGASIAWEPVSPRILTARFTSKGRTFTIIQCYSPTNAAKDQEKEEFYEKLQATFNKAPRRDMKIVMGDINAKVGMENAAKQRERWAEHFKEILLDYHPLSPPDASETLEGNMKPPTNAEIRKAIKTMKSGKAAGPDGIPSEALKDDINTSTDMLQRFLLSVVDKHGGTEEDIKSRTNKARFTFNRPIWNSSALSIRNKSRIFNANVKSVLLYGELFVEFCSFNDLAIGQKHILPGKRQRRKTITCAAKQRERWAEHLKEILLDYHPLSPPDASETLEGNMKPPTKAEIRKAIKTMKSGKAAGPDGIPSEALKDDINTSTNMLQRFLQKVWGWIGHTLRKRPTDITRQSLEWNPQGKRKVGQPKQTWRRNMRQRLGVLAGDGLN
ncbi:hypothetical protein EGW08_014821 [Elysia chlorotica]|uniref:DUF6451 domain-containing protein n=1 Tax=Elysia chlorotica TaxID=188477 RepID=A0A3S1B172_ELYCH|nr:hypothetical protein EGW08_014821 [Elysia chlorotica]